MRGESVLTKLCIIIIIPLVFSFPGFYFSFFLPNERA
jgi:hypothetical protein